MQLKSTWRDVAKKDGCREAAAFAVCKRSAAVKRNCLTRYEHGELLSTPRGYTWTGNRGLGYIAKRCSRLRRTQALPVGGVSRKRAIAAAKTNDDPAAMWQRFVKQFLRSTEDSVNPSTKKTLAKILLSKTNFSDPKWSADAQNELCDFLSNLNVECDSVKWKQQFLKTLSSLVLNYIIQVVCSGRMSRKTKLTDEILKRITSITEEQPLNSDPGNFLQAVQVFVAHMLYPWLVKPNVCRELAAADDAKRRLLAKKNARAAAQRDYGCGKKTFESSNDRKSTGSKFPVKSKKKKSDRGAANGRPRDDAADGNRRSGRKNAADGNRRSGRENAADGNRRRGRDDRGTGRARKGSRRQKKSDGSKGGRAGENADENAGPPEPAAETPEPAAETPEPADPGATVTTVLEAIGDDDERPGEDARGGTPSSSNGSANSGEEELHPQYTAADGRENVLAGNDPAETSLRECYRSKAAETSAVASDASETCRRDVDRAAEKEERPPLVQEESAADDGRRVASLQQDLDDPVLDELGILSEKMVARCEEAVKCSAKPKDEERLNKLKRNVYRKFEYKAQRSTMIKPTNRAVAKAKKCDLSPGVIYHICKKDGDNYSVRKTILPIVSKNSDLNLTASSIIQDTDSWKFDFNKCVCRKKQANTTCLDEKLYKTTKCLVHK